MVVTGTVVLKKRNTKQNAQISDDPTAKKLSSNNNEKEKRDNKRGVFRRIGLALKVEKENSEVGSTLKKKKKNRPSVRTTMRNKRTPYVMDTKVHFPLTKAHANIPLKGEEITAGQKQAFHKFATELVKKGPYELSMEFMSKVKTYVGQPMKREIFDANPTKNRYKDVICNDITRVAILDGKEDSLGDYIHANYVNGLNSQFILTQGPLERTTVDFWRMVMYTKACYIVMLCETNEDGKPKCNQYWPDKIGESCKYGDFTITCKTEDDKDKDEHVIKTVLTLKNGDKEHSLRHLHTKSWPDKSVPNSTLSLLRMLHIVRTSPGPVVVHCSAGIGRTGTFVAVEACLQVLADEKELDLIGCLKALRNGRLGSVQVDIQYMTLVQILLNFGKDNGYWDDSDLDDRVELLTWNISQFITTRGKPHSDPPPQKKEKVNNKDYSDDDDKEEKVQATQYMAPQDPPQLDKTVCLPTPLQSEAEAAPTHAKHPLPHQPTPAPVAVAAAPSQPNHSTPVVVTSSNPQNQQQQENSKDKESHIIMSKEATGIGRAIVPTHNIPKTKIEHSHYIG